MIEIKITGENIKDIKTSLWGLLESFVPPMQDMCTGEVLLRSEEEVKEVRKEKMEKVVKEKKAKEEKVTEPKAEVLAPEKPKYTLQDAIDRAREIAGDGQNEKIMNALKGINTRLGISKVREIPPEKLDGYMRELNAEFPKETKVETSANMFD